MKIGVIGAGLMGSVHAKAWTQTGATLVGICASSVTSAQRLADQFQVRAYGNFQEMLPDVDVVDICAPTYLHCEMVLRAAEARKEIICEKPLALTVEQGSRMLAACRRYAVHLLVAQVLRYFPEYVEACQIVQSGQIGKPGIIRLQRGGHRPQQAENNWFLDPAKSGGMMLDLMIHDFDFARWIAGEVSSVFARQTPVQGLVNPVQYGVAILKHANGVLSHVAGAWAYPPPTFRTRMEIACESGLIEFDSRSTEAIESLLPVEEGASANVALPASPLMESPYLTQIKEFYQTLCTGCPSRVSAEDALAALQIAVAAIQSARSGKAVHLHPSMEVQP